MEALHALGLVMTERESWPEKVRLLVQCTCACYCWGLTRAGVQLAEQLNVQLTDDARRKVLQLSYEKAARRWVVEGDGVEKSRWTRVEIDEDDDGDIPTSV